MEYDVFHEKKWDASVNILVVANLTVINVFVLKTNHLEYIDSN